MSTRRVILGIDCDAWGASAVAGDPLFGNEPDSADDGFLVYGALAGAESIVHASEGDGLPYRLDFGDPVSIDRDIQGSRLSERHPLSKIEPNQRGEHWEAQSRAIRFLVHQMAPAAPKRVGIVVPDKLDPESADIIFRALRMQRSCVDLLPLPIAAAWAWILKRPLLSQREFPGHKAIIGKLIVVHLYRDRWEAVHVHVVDNGNNVMRNEVVAGRGAPRFVPARDRDHDDTDSGTWDSESPSQEKLREAFNALGGMAGDHVLGLVVSGRPVEIGRLAVAHQVIQSIVGVTDAETAIDCDERAGLLAHGALHASAQASLGHITYYESLPRIEVRGSIEVWEDQWYQSQTWLSYWVDALEGVEEAALHDGNRKLYPANRKFDHYPNYSDNLVIEPRKRMPIYVAFEGRDVRCIHVDVPESVKSKEAVRLRVEYQLGAGRPILTFQREGNSPIEFDWDKAETVWQYRDEMTEHNAESARAEKERRIQERLRLYFHKK